MYTLVENVEGDVSYFISRDAVVSEEVVVDEFFVRVQVLDDFASVALVRCREDDDFAEGGKLTEKLLGVGPDIDSRLCRK